MNKSPSLRAQLITRRTYNRPTDDSGKNFESWGDTIGRVISHQSWLWERAKGSPLVYSELEELRELRTLMLDRKVSVSGRTLWLGGTEVAKTREASQFNCSFTHIETIQDIVDVLWLLLQGCGVGFRPIVGQLTGFSNRIEDIEVIKSTRTTKGGEENNKETFEDGVWTITVGDSAEAWAKSIGKLMAHPYPAKKLVLDFSQIRPAGERLKGYGWISSGDAAITTAYLAIAQILNNRAGSLLSRIDILDIANWLGTVLSSRRSAEIALFNYGEDEWEEFAVAKKNFWEGNIQRAQSNNSLLFKTKPTREQLADIFDLMVASGGSEPGFINGQTATHRAPWFKGVNPCAEILLGNKSFCNLTEIDVGKFKGDSSGLRRAMHLAARANYRQTCVNLSDGILQEGWHLNNAFLRLCGVGITGIVRRPDLRDYDYSELSRTATSAAFGMADELGLPRPKNVTTVKPSGTLSKIMDTTEGLHKPLGKYIFNNVNFSKHDPLVPLCRAAGYKVIDNPMDADAVLITFPVVWNDVPFTKVTIDGQELEVNLETALSQLERYKMLMKSWCQQNVSATISYSVDEVPGIVDWLLENWDNYVGVSFLFRADPTKTAKDLGYLYLPQEVVTKEAYEEYAARLQHIDIDQGNSFDELSSDECASGVCPVR
ncbi:ribonucleoside-triphosphate reductase, adenosylcobalamin-dependent [Polynucleobacter sp. MG-27-Goln-C1]|uniref:ribonucleoside-triphosphate reductase, adenosylcobalamin-dependent n=1 Tax=Polynucleobacter sp. MG-27-Goln-C1 TaxID=1819726 RepID=UPI001C0DFFB9|nr:ribonucleoside-triphosphate reductase, adenosylcobalamin-dependent [Polynucleobacter sp. MG-27-Goln-C1]MBU3613172.1 ribonucleoside-triphosphate reductase, adenosylcobalamin-dependent [Polynucleobacter sp. MG-27-Goln-C1]